MPDTTDFSLDDDDHDIRSKTLDFGLLANFVHQVINPLSGTSGHIGNLIDGTIPESKREQRLKAARAQLEHAISLMRNLAYFSQISINASNTNPGAIRKVCVIPQTIIEAIQFYQEMASKKNISVQLVNRSDQFKVTGNPDLLRQVFMNMVDNAVKYAYPGTRVTFDLRVQRKTNSLIVEITSKGVTIDPDERNRLFDLGFRGKSARRTVASGTGLGLNICKTIIESVHRGSIDVESSSDGTTKFLIKFPEYTMG